MNSSDSPHISQRPNVDTHTYLHTYMYTLLLYYVTPNTLAIRIAKHYKTQKFAFQKILLDDADGDHGYALRTTM